MYSSLALAKVILPALLYASTIDARGVKERCFDENHKLIPCPKKPGLTTGKIVAIVIAALLVLLVIAILVWMFLRRKRRSQRKYGDESHVALTHAPYDPQAPYDPPKAPYDPPQGAYAPPPQAAYAPPPGPPPQGAAASYYNS